jgi:DNA end-binding protein Ku
VIVDYDDIVKGFEVRSGEWVELTDDEIAAAAGSGTRLVDLDHFVPAGEIDPVYYERTYHLGVGKGGERAYAVLHAALKRSERAGVGRWVFHNRERAVIVRVRGVLAMHTMRFADSIVDPKELELPRLRRRPAKRETEDYEDEYREAVLEVVRRKAEGKNIEPPEAEEEESSGDLLAALEASLKGS